MTMAEVLRIYEASLVDGTFDESRARDLVASPLGWPSFVSKLNRLLDVMGRPRIDLATSTATPPSPRGECYHLGRVTDRLGCNCPRRWIRVCSSANAGNDGQTTLNACERCPSWQA